MAKLFWPRFCSHCMMNLPLEALAVTSHYWLFWYKDSFQSLRLLAANVLLIKLSGKACKFHLKGIKVELSLSVA